MIRRILSNPQQFLDLVVARKKLLPAGIMSEYMHRSRNQYVVMYTTNVLEKEVFSLRVMEFPQGFQNIAFKKQDGKFMAMFSPIPGHVEQLLSQNYFHESWKQDLEEKLPALTHHAEQSEVRETSTHGTVQQTSRLDYDVVRIPLETNFDAMGEEQIDDVVKARRGLKCTLEVRPMLAAPPPAGLYRIPTPPMPYAPPPMPYAPPAHPAAAKFQNLAFTLVVEGETHFDNEAFEEKLRRAEFTILDGELMIESNLMGD